MQMIRRHNDRGHADYGWLDTRHTFSFGSYFDKQYMGFGPLRVFNEDRITGGSGFETHGHKNMEIISYVISGGLEHKDSMGHSSVLNPKDVQVMTAGTGIQHSEFNHFKDQSTHFLQIWIIPESEGLTPRYQQKSFGQSTTSSDFRLIASKNGQDGSLTINQDVKIYLQCPAAMDHCRKSIALQPSRRYWIQLIDGTLTVNNTQLSAGDGIGLYEIDSLALEWESSSHFLLLDLPV